MALCYRSQVAASARQPAITLRAQKKPRGSDSLNLGRLLEGMRAAMGQGSAESVAVQEISLVNAVNAQSDMRQLAMGDLADILQNVEWQLRLYQAVPALKNLKCAPAIRERLAAFAAGYSRRRVTAKEYPSLIRALLPCLRETALAVSRQAPGLEQDLGQLGAQKTLAGFQKAHRAILLKLQQFEGNS